MNKFVFVFYCLLISNFVVIAQNLEIRSIELFQYNLGSNYDPFYEAHWGGPSITITFLLVNNTTDEILLSMDSDSVEISFRHDKKDYFEYSNARFPYNDRSTLLQTNDSITIRAGTNILLGTDLFKKPGEDYRNTLLQVLPTLSVRYYVSSSLVIVGDRKKIDIILRE